MLNAKELEFYIGTYTDGHPNRGIYRSVLDSETGQLSEPTLAIEAKNPSYVAVSPDGQFAYAAMEAGEAAVGAFQRNDNGSLTALNNQPSGGKGACHVSIDPSGKVAFVANYGSGDIASFPIQEDGSLGEQASHYEFIGHGPNERRQKSPHAHAVVTSPDGKHAYACDLGTDSIWIYEIDSETGTLTTAEQAKAHVPPGEGPRHIIFSKDGRQAYVNNEMGLSTTAFERDPETGTLSILQTIPTHLEAPEAPESLKTAAILIHPTGKWLYVTSRGDDIIAVYAIQDDGTLELIQNAPAQVKTPRGAGMDPTGQWLVVAGQDDNTLTALKIDPETGLLTAGDSTIEVQKPVCITFMP